MYTGNSSESRTEGVGNKRSFASTSNSTRPRKRRRNGIESDDQNSAMEAQSSALTNPTNFDGHIENLSTALVNQDPNQIEDYDSTNNMDTANFGRNRLAMGFVKPHTNRQASKSSGEISDSSSANIAMGESSASPIEISDDEMEESEGGMVLNMDQDNNSIQELSSDDSRSQESGEIAPTPKITIETSGNPSDLFTVDPTPAISVKRLTDLSAEELEDQLRYAFFHLDRQRIDLSRPVVCLVCAGEGHLQHDCEEGKQNVFPTPKTHPDNQVRLWISCCVCASKSHLVGDCPRMLDGGAARWSLASAPLANVVNLSLETGMQKLEQEAKNKGLRPVGLQIKGRAGLHSTKAPQNRISSDEDDEPFLRKPVGRKETDHYNGSLARPQRYDRYDPPSNHQPYRGGGEWYSTDSFGRRRSRSPDDRIDSYRPRNEYNRSRTSPQRDSWRPPPPGERRDTYRNRPDSPSRRTGDPSMNQPTSNIQFSLPTRKGSNNWSQGGQSGGSVPAANNKRADTHQQRRKRNKNNKK